MHGFSFFRGDATLGLLMKSDKKIKKTWIRNREFLSRWYF
jgi:hypothetical protein